MSILSPSDVLLAILNRKGPTDHAFLNWVYRKEMKGRPDPGFDAVVAGLMEAKLVVCREGKYMRTSPARPI